MAWARVTYRARQHAVLVLAILFAAASVFAEHLPIKLYTTADGLARNRVHGIMADSRGFLWISTAEGLSLFDGNRFVNYGTRDGLASPVITAVLETRGGEYWVSTDEGVCILHPKDRTHLFTLYHHPAAEYLHGVNALLQDRSGAIWAATDDGLYRETNPGSGSQGSPEWIDLGLPHTGQEMRALLEDRQGSLWIGSGPGLFRRYADGRVESYSTNNGLPTTYVEKLVQDGEGRIWAGTRLGLCRLVADPRPGQNIVERVYTEADGLGSKDVKALAVAPDGAIWAGLLFGGLSEIRIPAHGPARIRTFGKPQGLSDESITALEYDREGNLWAGGESGGLMRILRSGLVTYTIADGLVSDRVSEILEDHDGDLCVPANDLATRRAYITCLSGEKFRRIAYPARYNWPAWRILQDRSGAWWLGKEGLVRLGVVPLAQLPSARAEHVFTDPNIQEVSQVFEDSAGGIWVSSRSIGNRVARWDEQGGLHLLPRTNGPIEQLVTAFAEDHAGNIWMGLYRDGVLRYRNGVIMQFGERDGFPVNYISKLFTDDAGRLWVGALDGGLGRVDSPDADHPAMRRYDAAHGLSSDHVTSIAADQWGRVYIGTGRGVDLLDPASERITHYSSNDGLATDTALTILRDSRGWMWFGTTQGLSRLIPEAEQPAAPPQIRITSLAVGGVPYAVSQLGESELAGLEFAHGDLQIGFSSFLYEAGELLHYQYRIEGAGGKWSAPDDQRTVSLAGLSPGVYRFEVRAVNSRGQVSERPAAIGFRIPPPIWARTWFRLLCVAAGSVLLYGLYRFRLDRMLELEHIRMRIATDLHDDIGSSLSQIAILSEVARRQGEAGASELDPLGGIARISRELVDSMSDIVWAVNPKRDNLLDLTRRMRQFAGEMLVPGGIDFTFDAEGAPGQVALGADPRRQIFLIYKECIHNIVRHSGAVRVEILFAMAGTRLQLTIRDNGRGFDPQQLSQGHGLASMRNRAASLGGAMLIKSAAGAGTTVCLEIPLSRHRIW